MRSIIWTTLAAALVFVFQEACSAPQGPQGDPGAAGAAGTKGDPGAKGDPGMNGNPADIQKLDASTPWPGRLIMAKNGKSYSLDATYCGKTAQTSANIVSGNLTGYAGAKAQCEQTCTSPSAHMCSAEELIRTRQIGTALPMENAWFAGGTYNYYPSSSSTTDCQGFTTGAGPSGYLAPCWQANGIAPTICYCSNTLAILCCD